MADTGRFTAASALAAGAIPNLRISGRDTIKVALVGCGGRGTGAAVNALSVPDKDIQLVALADVFEGKPARTATRSLGASSAQPTDSWISRWKCAPIPARRTFGDQHQAVPGAVITRCTPTAAQVRRIVPTLPGSWIRSR